jgi:hypothetical protein
VSYAKWRLTECCYFTETDTKYKLWHFQQAAVLNQRNVQYTHFSGVKVRGPNVQSDQPSLRKKINEWRNKVSNLQAPEVCHSLHVIWRHNRQFNNEQRRDRKTISTTPPPHTNVKKPRHTYASIHVYTDERSAPHGGSVQKLQWQPTRLSITVDTSSW